MKVVQVYVSNFYKKGVKNLDIYVFPPMKTYLGHIYDTDTENRYFTEIHRFRFHSRERNTLNSNIFFEKLLHYYQKCNKTK